MVLTDLMAAVHTLVLPAASRDGLLHTAAELLACREASIEELHRSLIERESLGSTAIGHGIAIPHARCDRLEEPRAALIRVREPVLFGSDTYVDLVFAMAIPGHYIDRHLALLSALAERFSEDDYLRSLREAEDSAALLRAFSAHPPALASAA